MVDLDGLENRCAVYSVPRVRIPLSPPDTPYSNPGLKEQGSGGASCPAPACLCGQPARPAGRLGTPGCHGGSLMAAPGLHGRCGA